MISPLDTLLLLVLLLNLYALGTSRMAAVIRAVAFQGLLLGILPMLGRGPLRLEIVAMGSATAALKAFVIPAMLFRAMRQVQIKHEVEPFIGPILSMTIGAAATGLALAFAARLPLLPADAGSLIVPTSLSTGLTGFILLATRLKAISQVLGYLVMENGIFIFGLLLLDAMPVVVEMGALLDLFVGVFVICIIINHINRAFDSISTRNLATLREQPMVTALVCIPLVAALVACVVRSERWRPWILPPVAALHLGMTITAITGPQPAPSDEWLALDPPARLVLLVASLLFFFCSLYAVNYLRHHAQRSNTVFCACMLAFLGMMSLVACAHHLGLMWVAIEATTLATAPLIYFNQTPKCLEATWKYLLVCSVGIAVALLGSFFLAYALLHGGLEPTLDYGDLLRNAPQLSRPWLRAAFILLLVGYGTKVGLAPMHTWLPDAHSEAPSPVSALLSGALLNCAFLGVLRANHLCAAAGEGKFAASVLIFVGLLSMAVAAVFVVGQRDFKRMLAYSSVENMGILAMGVGVGGLAASGALLHVVTNGLTKGMLFLSAGTIHESFGSKMAGPVRGAMRRLPLSGTVFLLGFLAITGSPPFGPFVSQFAILNGTLHEGRFVVAGLYLALLLIVFLGMSVTVLTIVQGRPPALHAAARAHSGMRGEHVLAAVPMLALLALVVMLGICVPAPLEALVENASAYLESWSPAQVSPAVAALTDR